MTVNVQQVAPSKLLRGKSRHLQGISSHVGDLKLRGDDIREKLDAEITDVRLTRAIDVSSSVEIDLYDPHLEALNSKLCKERVDVELDGLWFRTFAIAGSERITTLRFEDREIARQRKHTGARKANRDKMTRAEFCVSLLLEAKPNPPIYCPELHTVQPIANAAQGRQAGREVDVTRGKGLDSGAKLTVKGVQANAGQIKLADRMMRAAVSFGATNEVLQGLVCALINETLIQNLSGGDRTSTGPLQVLASTAAAVHVDPRDPEGITKVFVQHGFTGAGGALELSKKMGVDQWLGLVMYSANGTPYPGLQYLDEAQKWVDAFGGGASGTITTTREKPYQFQRKPNENTWTAVGRLMEEVRWLRFCSGGIIYLIAETDLLASKVRMHITPQTEGVDRITSYDLTIGKKNDEVQLSAWVRNWAAPPGSVAELDGYGPLDGRYIVSAIGPMSLRGDAETRKCDITLKRPQKPLPEPAAETVTKSKSFDMGGGSGGSGSPTDLRDVKVNTSLGDPHWGGSADVMHQVVDPIAKRHGLTPGATKEGGHTPGGDHDPAVTNAYATDYPTTSGESFANDAAGTLGDASVVHSYDAIYFSAGGYKFRAQVLWDLTNPQPGYGDYAHRAHVHVGIRRA